MKNIKKKIFNSIYWLLLIFVLGIALVTAISAVQIDIPYRMYAVQTGSMEPTIKVGDLIFIKKSKEYKEGDIITFLSGTGKSRVTITHRITKVTDENTFVTKGDANAAEDIDRVKYEDIFGKYIFKIPLLGYPINLVKTPLGFLILIVIPAVIISYEELKKIKNEISKKQI